VLEVGLAAAEVDPICTVLWAQQASPAALPDASAAVSALEAAGAQHPASALAGAVAWAASDGTAAASSSRVG
jgi:hypothetical protein